MKKFNLITLSILFISLFVANDVYAAKERVEIIDVSTGKRRIIPDGTSGYALKTNGAGVISWGEDEGGLGTDVVCSSCVALGSETSGDYVAGLSEGNYIDVSGSGGEGSTVTVTFDPTEVTNVTWGAGSSFAWTFNSDATTDPVLTFDDEITSNVPFNVGGSGSQVTGSNGVYVNFATTDTIYFGMTGGSQNEVFGFNLDTTANTVDWVTSSSVTAVDTNQIDIVGEPKRLMAFCVLSPSTSSDSIKVPFQRAITLTKITLFATGGTNVVGRFYEVDGDGDQSDQVGIETSDWTVTSGTETEDTSFNNATLDAGDYLAWDTTSVSGSVTSFCTEAYGYES